MHSVQGGYTDKALSYAEKALHFMPNGNKGMYVCACVCMCVHALRMYVVLDCGVVSILRAHLLEQIIQCLLMKGDTANSADKV